jgi:hypothetical protein
VLLTSVIDAVEERVIAVYNIPGAFLNTAQTDIVHFKMTGELVEICPTSYTDYVIWENGKKSIYLRYAFLVC